MPTAEELYAQNLQLRQELGEVRTEAATLHGQIQ